MSDQSQGPGWWMASDGKWYPPAPAPPGLPVPPPPPLPSSAAPVQDGPRYDAVVNKKSINMAVLTSQLNQRWKQGWRLAHVYEQAGNSVMIFERRD